MNKQEEKEMVDTLSDRLESMVSERFKTVLKRIEELNKTVTGYGNEALNDRKDISDMKISMATLSQQMEELREGLGKQQRTLTSKVEDTVDKSIDTISQTVSDNVQPMVEKTLNKFVEKKGNEIEVKKKKRFWFF